MTKKVLRVTGDAGRQRTSFLDEQLATGAADTHYDESDAAERPVEGDSLKALQALAQELIASEREVARTGAEYARAVAALEDVQEHRLPDLMSRHNLPSFEFVDAVTGTRQTITYKNGWRVLMPPKQDEEGIPIAENLEKRRQICQWFRQIGLAGLVRKEMKVPMGLLDDALVTQIVSAFKAANPNLDPGVIEDINASTLRAQIKRRKEKNLDIHPDIICNAIHKAIVK